VASARQPLRALSPGWALLAPLPFVADAAWAIARGQLRWENVAAVVLVLALLVAGPRAKRLLIGAYPLGLVGVLYDAMRLVRRVGVTTDSVHLCDLRAHELVFFSVALQGERVTLHDWFQAHPSPILDALCAVPYATFLLVCVACAAWLSVRNYERMVRFGWCFLALNVAAFVTYHVYPAAPPWYYHAHGCYVDVLAPASEGPSLARIDARLGVPYFRSMYGRSTSVFGALPSLHCAYALLVAVEGWAFFRTGWRVASAAFFLWMCFSAVYLDHHWVLDVIAGIGYCLVVAGAARAVDAVRSRRTKRTSGPP
jgi:membrane-associated phospholipid phosphatase